MRGRLRWVVQRTKLTSCVLRGGDKTREPMNDALSWPREIKVIPKKEKE